MFGKHKELATNMLLGRIQSVDLTQFKENEPKEDPLYDIIANMMKHIHDSYNDFILFLDEISQDLINLEKLGEIDYINRIMNYVTVTLKLTNEKEFNEIMKKCLPTSIEENFMTTGAEIFRKVKLGAKLMEELKAV